LPKSGQFTNIAEVLQQHNNLIIEARAELYNQSALSARFNFDMTSNNYFNYWWKSIYSGTKKVLGIEPKE